MSKTKIGILSLIIAAAMCLAAWLCFAFVPAHAAAVSPDDSPEAVFGLFLRRLRKLPKSGVAYALCRDLVPSREGELFVLTTDVRTVCDTLNSERHRPTLAEVLSEIGVTQFEVRFAGAARSEQKDGIQKLKEDFAGYPVEVR